MALGETPQDRAVADAIRRGIPGSWVVVGAQRVPQGIEVTLENTRPQPTPLRTFLIRPDGTNAER